MDKPLPISVVGMVEVSVIVSTAKGVGYELA
jgi:hypothetical protein